MLVVSLKTKYSWISSNKQYSNVREVIWNTSLSRIMFGSTLGFPHIRHDNFLYAQLHTIWIKQMPNKSIVVCLEDSCINEWKGSE